MTTVNQIYSFIDKIAPFKLAEKSDNVGLLVGEKTSEVKKALLSLDITNAVANEAKSVGAELLISHHPIIFNPLYVLNDKNPACFLLKNNINAICAHTNLDMAKGGVNDILAESLGLKDTGRLIETIYKIPYKQVVVFVPEGNAENVYSAMCNAGGGTQGNYSGCAFSCNGIGKFLPEENAKPFIGVVGEIEEVHEVRLEMLVKPSCLNAVISALKASHPYEEPAYQVLDNNALTDEYGFGKICTLEKEMTPKELAGHIKASLNCTVIRYVDGGNPIKTVAFCSGGGGSLINDAIALGVDAYICGDIKHDQFVTAKNSDFSIFDAGHFHTETIVLPYLKKALSAEFPNVVFEIAKGNCDPVTYM